MDTGVVADLALVGEWLVSGSSLLAQSPPRPRTFPGQLLFSACSPACHTRTLHRRTRTIHRHTHASAITTAHARTPSMRPVAADDAAKWLPTVARTVSIAHARAQHQPIRRYYCIATRISEQSRACLPIDSTAANILVFITLESPSLSASIAQSHDSACSYPTRSRPTRQDNFPP